MSAWILGVGDAASVAVAFIGACATIGVALVGLRGISAQVKQLDTNNSLQHGGVAEAVKRMGHQLATIGATVNALVDGQHYPRFRNAPDGSLIAANVAAQQMLGMSYEDMLDPDKWIEAIHPDDRKKIRENWNRQIDSGTQLPPIRYRYVNTQSGRVTWVDGISVPVTDMDGGIVEWLSIAIPLDEPAHKSNPLTIVGGANGG